ncbi:acetyl esterase/lipase [Fontibacillus solani]|uniref:Acetyl esterase/lipase n=1 Tax=Fontibacillus solani TaxID=1572857 RepID=A0A7W3SRP8_9BACL|nr:alpha/beta hydrolase [Fontibacillus solani]MBA9084854.1 acetyl esterase/lipase [Fontibacillus solani]
MKETRIYKDLDDCLIKADVYNHGTGTPVLVYLHSGGFIFGSRSWLPTQQIEWYKKAGFSIVSIDYRLAPNTKLPEIVQDVKDAIYWVRQQAVQHYDFDPNRMALVGSSAGGYMSLLAGTMEEIKPKAIVSFYGYGDLLGDWIMKPSRYYCQKQRITTAKAQSAIEKDVVSEGSWDRYDYYIYCRQTGRWVEEVTGLDRVKDLEALQSFSPVLHLTKDYPPTMLLHGNCDTDVPYEQSVMMYEKLQQVGVTSELITIDGGDHVFDQNFYCPAVQDAFQKVNAFLRHFV